MNCHIKGTRNPEILVMFFTNSSTSLSRVSILITLGSLLGLLSTKDVVPVFCCIVYYCIVYFWVSRVESERM